MIDTDNFYSLGPDYFSFSNNKCRFNIRKNGDNNTVTKNLLTVSTISDEIVYYSFSGSNGLCVSTEHGSIKHKNVLGVLLSLPPNNAKALLSFFEEFGFFFKLPPDKETIVNFEQLVEITNHIKSIVLLMNEIQNSSKDYNNILHLTLYLLLAPKIKIELSDDRTYSGYHDSVLDIIDRAQNNISDSNYITIDGEDYYEISDVIYGKSYNMKVDEYEDISNGEQFMYSYPGITDRLYRKITIAYKNLHYIPKIQRLIIEFLFHFYNSNGVIKKVFFEKGIEFYGNSSINLDDKMKSALIIISKYILSQEINYNVAKMKPLYNPNTLEPTWKAANFLTALYFSLFYMKPKSEIYRKCANPSCTNFFLVKTSNSRKKYCCGECRNASNVRSYRMRQKK